MSAPPAAAPSGVVTFLFTDVEGSTGRWEADADEMRAALAAHDELLRTVVETHGGWLFKHTGDGVCAAFASPRSAVDAAVAAQRALELPVRMGLATGEAELRDGDYFGAVLNRAARVMAAGHGGQILLAESTAILLSGVDLVNLGPRRLRDVPMPVGVFQVRAADLQTNFPPLRALDTTPGNLRPATTSLIGRESEVADIQAAIKAHRLVTLTGVGGVGKTRLATEVAAHLADEFPDGVWLFELAAVTDPAAVPDAVAAVLGITQQPGKTVSDSVAAALEGRVRLLVIDNCEHVLDAAAEIIEAILARSATVKVLATSREGLRIADEQLWLVPSLDVDAGTESAAVRLFVERARSVAQRFSLTGADEAAAVLEICRRLDGIPLAIELAASRMASMTASEVRDRLDQRFRLLVGSRRGLEHHQTLRHTVAWSYEHLADPEKVLLDRCSVFAAGFDLQSACAVAGSDDVDDFAILDLLDALVRKSLLVADRASGRTRFSTLETIRQFAEEQLVASGAAPGVRAAHARYFAGRETDILALWDSPRQRDAYEWFATEFPNLRAAFRWSADQGELDTAVGISTYAAFLGYMTESYEPIAWVEEVIPPARSVNHPRLAFLYIMASVCWMAGRVEPAVAYTSAGQAILNGGPCELPLGVDGLIGSVYLAVGQPERYVEMSRVQLARGRGANPMSRASLVLALAVAGTHDEAMSALVGVVDAAEASRNPAALSLALLACGYAFRDVDPARALAALRRGLLVAQENGLRTYETHLAASLARIETIRGDPLAALDYLTLAIRNYQDSGNIVQVQGTLRILAACLQRVERYEAAATIVGFAPSDLTDTVMPEINAAITRVRHILGDEAYKALARKGAELTIAAALTYAYDQIDQARAELNAVSK